MCCRTLLEIHQLGGDSHSHLLFETYKLPIHLMITVLIYICFSFIKKNNLQHQIRHVRVPKDSNIDDVKLGRTFYRCSCGASLSFFGLSWEYCFEIEKLNLWSSHWAMDDKTLGGTWEVCARGRKEARSCRLQEAAHVPALTREGNSWCEMWKATVEDSVLPWPHSFSHSSSVCLKQTCPGPEKVW